MSCALGVWVGSTQAVVSGEGSRRMRSSPSWSLSQDIPDSRQCKLRAPSAIARMIGAKGVQSYMLGYKIVSRGEQPNESGFSMTPQVSRHASISCCGTFALQRGTL